MKQISIHPRTKLEASKSANSKGVKVFAIWTWPQDRKNGTTIAECLVISTKPPREIITVISEYFTTLGYEGTITLKALGDNKYTLSLDRRMA